MPSTKPSTSFQTILDEAVADYTNQIGVDQAHHDSANWLQSCQSPTDVLKVLEDKANKFKDHREGNRKLIDCLKPVVKVIHKFSNVLGQAASSVPFQPAGLIFAGVDVLLTASAQRLTLTTCPPDTLALLQTANDVSSDYDALVDLFECVGNFLKRLEVYNTIPSTPLMREIIKKIMIEVLSVLDLATKQIKDGRFKKFAKKLLGESEIDAVLQRLDRLTREEGQRAMAQTLEVVYSLMNNVKVVMNDGKVSMAGILNALETMQHIVLDINKIANNQFQEKSRSWLSPPDSSRNYNIARGFYQKGTTEWFFRDGHFVEWKARGSLLWIRGKPGSGKSILISSIIEEVDSMRKAGLAWMAFFFFDFRDVEKQRQRDLLSSLLWQLSDMSDPCCHILFRLYSENGEGKSEPPVDALFQCLTEMLKVQDRPATYIVIDALDESPNVFGIPTEREKVLDSLDVLVRLRLPNLHICVSSRLESDIQTKLMSLPLFTVSLDDEKGQKDDISRYINAIVQSDPRMRTWTKDDKKLVIDTLTDKSDGMFRWVYCQLDNLRRGFPSSIRGVLDQLPETLDEVYEHALLRIDQTRRQFASRLFQCLAVSARPLCVEELADILAIQFDTGGAADFNVDWRLGNAEDAVLYACSSLITVVDACDGSRVVQFFHFSVKEFLTSDRLAKARPELSFYHVTPQSANATFARACLSVLLTLDEKNIDRERIKDFPLADYASRYWFDHCGQLECMPKDIQDATLRLFDQDGPHFSAWVWLYDMDDPSRESMATERPERPKAAPLYYAVRGGFSWLVEDLVAAQPEDINDRGGYFETPLFEAFAMEDVKLAMSLLQRGADPNVLDNDGTSVLHYAAQTGDVDFVWSLLIHNADVDCLNTDGQTPLGLSSAEGQLEVCHLLVQRGANVHARDNDGRAPLWNASYSGHLDVVKFLVDRGADVNSADNEGLTPFYSALSQGNVGVVDFLLDHGADLNLRNADAKIAPNLGSSNGKKWAANLISEHLTGSRDSGECPPLIEETSNTVDDQLSVSTASKGGRVDTILVSSYILIPMAYFACRNLRSPYDS